MASQTRADPRSEKRVSPDEALGPETGERWIPGEDSNLH